MIDAEDFDLGERLQPIRCHPELRHLGAFVASAHPWHTDRSTRTDGEQMSDLTAPFLSADTIDDLDIDERARAFRRASSATPTDGWFGFCLAISEMRGLVDGGAIDLERYRVVAEMMSFVAEWAAETVAEEAAQNEAGPTPHQGLSAEQPHQVAGGPVCPLPAPVSTSSHQPRKVLVRS